jgi:hypothetical protein
MREVWWRGETRWRKEGGEDAALAALAGLAAAADAEDEEAADAEEDIAVDRGRGRLEGGRGERWWKRRRAREMGLKKVEGEEIRCELLRMKMGHLLQKQIPLPLWLPAPPCDSMPPPACTMTLQMKHTCIHLSGEWNICR